MSPENGEPAAPPEAHLALRVFPEEGALVWEATNAGAGPVRLWEQSNSWGWPMPRLSLESGGGEAHVLRPAPRVWTRNFPSSLELAPHESARYALSAEDFDPEALEPLRRLWDQPLRVRGELRCEASAEAIEHQVWCGTLHGPEQELSPPHAWLRGEAGSA